MEREIYMGFFCWEDYLERGERRKRGLYIEI